MEVPIPQVLFHYLIDIIRQLNIDNVLQETYISIIIRYILTLWFGCVFKGWHLISYMLEISREVIVSCLSDRITYLNIIVIEQLRIVNWISYIFIWEVIVNLYSFVVWSR